MSSYAGPGFLGTTQEPPSTSAFNPPRFRALVRSFPTHLCQLEAERALYCLWYQAEHRKEIWRRVFKLWPIVAGLVLAPFAPQFYAFLVGAHPWAMVVVFPFTLLARSTGLHMSDNLARVLPEAVLYLQFPVEGLIALLVVRRRVTLPAVTGQIFYYHYLASLELLMLSGIVRQLLIW